MSGTCAMAKLPELAELNPVFLESLERDAQVSFVPMSAVNAESSSVTAAEDRHYEEVSRGYTPFLNGDLLIAKITPCFENGKIAQARLSRPVGFGSTEFHVVRARPGKADARFLLHFLRQRRVLLDGERKMTGSAGQRRVPEHYLASLNVPSPPLTEQRRIAEILDGAEALRAKRRLAITQLDALVQSIFLELFGDPKLNERNWPLSKLSSVISDLRGGANLAPDDFVESGFPILHKGAIKPNGSVVLDVKKKTFATAEYAAANRRCQVNRKYLAVTLRDLVPTGPSIGLIASLYDGPCDNYLLAQGAYGFLVDSGRVTPEYLVYLSNMPSFRHILRKYSVGSTQIHIRTPVYLEISIPIPPLSIQREFSLRVAAVKRLRAIQLSSLKRLDSLFTSLQARAFIGGL